MIGRHVGHACLFSLKVKMMKKISVLLGILAFIAMSLSLTGCKDKPKPSPLTGFEQNLTNADSVAVMNLVNQFFEYAEHGKYIDAAAMLYEDDPDSIYNEPQLLNNEELQRIKMNLSSLPIQSHNIDYIKFHETYANEVKVTAVIAPAQGNMPEVKTVYYFKPINYNGAWKLCLVDSHNGDETIVKSAKKDSMEKEFQKEMRVKNLKKIDKANNK